MNAGVKLVTWSVAVALAACAPCLAAPALSPPLLIVETHSAGESQSHPGVYNAGTLNSIQSSEIDHTFTVRNATLKPVVIDNLTSSCDCTTALIKAGSHAETLPLTLAPGSSAQVRVEVDVEREVIGSLEKFVWLHARGQGAPAATLEVKATFPPLLIVTPQTIDFGRAHVGETHRITVYATVSPRLMAGQPVITLNSSIPYLSVGPPASAGTAPAPSGERGRWPRLAYLVSLAPNAPIGAFATDLSVELTRIGGMSQISEQALEDYYVVARGAVVGDIAVEPKSVVFGTVQVGNGAEKDVTVTAASPAILSQLTVASDSPWVSIQPASSPPGSVAGKVGPARTYTVSVSNSAPVGALDAKFTFGSAGQTLILSVLAYIAPNMAP